MNSEHYSENEKKLNSLRRRLITCLLFAYIRLVAEL